MNTLKSNQWGQVYTPWIGFYKPGPFKLKAKEECGTRIIGPGSHYFVANSYEEVIAWMDGIELAMSIINSKLDKMLEGMA